MIARPGADASLAAELGRRRRLAAALHAALEADHRASVAPGNLRRRLRSIAGNLRPTVAEMAAGVARLGGGIAVVAGRRAFVGVALRYEGPARGPWERQLAAEKMPPELDLVDRVKGKPYATRRPNRGARAMVVAVNDIPAGVVFRSPGDGTWRQARDDEAYLPSAIGSRNARRMPPYLARMQAYLNAADASGFWRRRKRWERSIIELHCAGATWEGIAAEVGCTRSRVRHVISWHRRRGGIAGPGAGS